MITGFVISEVSATIESAEALQKQHYPKLNINLEKVTANGEKADISYSFEADYMDGDAKSSKSVGKLKLGGTVEVSDSKANIDAMVKQWTEKKTLPVNIAEEVINGLNFRCGATGTLVAYSVGLIPPLVISTTRIQEQK